MPTYTTLFHLVCTLALALAAPAAPGRELLYRETFESPSPAVEVREGSWQAGNGFWRCDPRDQITQFFTLSGLNLADFDLRADVFGLQPASQGWPKGVGVWFRPGAPPDGAPYAAPYNSGYSVLLYTDGLYPSGSLALWWYNPHLQPPAWEARNAPHDPALIGKLANWNAAGQRYRLRVVAACGGLRVWVKNTADSDAPIMTLPLPDYAAAGEIGLFAANAGVYCDHVEVWDTDEPESLYFLRSGRMRCGFFLPWGGTAVDYRVDRDGDSDFADEPNFIDFYDNGRPLATAFWPVDYAVAENTPFGDPYNPAQGGYGHPLYLGSGVEEFDYEPERRLYVRTRPRNFIGPTTEPADVEVELVAEVREDDAVHVTYTFGNIGSVTRAWREHEVPALYAGDPLDYGYVYDGTQPWTAAPFTRLGPGEFNLGVRVVEPYYIFAGQDGYGLALGSIPMLPHPARMYPPYHLEDGTPFGRFHYSSFTPSFALVPGARHTAEVFLVSGRLDEMRAALYARTPHSRWEFSLGHEGWREPDGTAPAHDGAGRIAAVLAGPVGRLDSMRPLQVVADSHPRVSLRLAVPQGVQGIQLWWTRTDAPDFDASRSMAVPFDARQAPAQDLSVRVGDHPQWTGLIEQLRLQFAIAGTAAMVTLDRIEVEWDRSWHFNIDGFAELWYPHTAQQCRPLAVQDGLLRLRADGPYRAIESGFGLAVPTNSYSVLEVRARARSGGRMIAGFVTSSTDKWSMSKSRSAVLPAERWETLRFSFAGLPGYTGVVHALRLACSDAQTDDVDIDWIRLAAPGDPLLDAPPPPDAAPLPAPRRVGRASASVDVEIRQLTDSADGDSLWPAISGDGRRVVYCSSADPVGQNPDGNRELFLLKVGDTVPTQLTVTEGAECRLPAITRDGGRLFVFSSADLVPPGNAEGHFELFRFDREEGTWRQLTDSSSRQPVPHRRPAVSSDGRLAVVVRHDGDTGRLLLCNDGTVETLFESDDGFGFDGPAISGDGRWVAVTAAAALDPRAPDDGAVQTMLLDRAGGGVTQIGRERRVDPIGMGGCCLARDGSLLVLHADRWLVPREEFRNWDRGYQNNIPSEIFYYDTATGLLTQKLDTYSGRFSDRPAVSADGAHTVFVSSEDHVRGHNPDWLPQLFLQARNSVEQLTGFSVSDGITDTLLSIDDDGDRIVFHSTGDLIPGRNADGSAEVFLLRRRPPTRSSSFFLVSAPLQ